MRLSDETLMLFHDGELEPERARAVRVGRLVAPDVGARLEGLEALGTHVRAWARRAGIDASAERRRIERARVRRRLLGLGAALAFAALLVPGAALELGRAGAGKLPPLTPFSARGQGVVVSGPVAVETVDFGARPGAIFRVPSGGATETTVVWLGDDGDVGATSSL